jgi:hypothetical protein
MKGMTGNHRTLGLTFDAIVCRQQTNTHPRQERRTR